MSVAVAVVAAAPKNRQRSLDPLGLKSLLFFQPPPLFLFLLKQVLMPNALQFLLLLLQ